MIFQTTFDEKVASLQNVARFVRGTRKWLYNSRPQNAKTVWGTVDPPEVDGVMGPRGQPQQLVPFWIKCGLVKNKNGVDPTKSLPIKSCLGGLF